MAYLSALPTTGNRIPPNNHAVSADLAVDDEQRGTNGKDGLRSNSEHFFRSIYVIYVITRDCGDLVEKNPRVENGEGLLGARQVVWKDGLAYLYDQQ